MPHRRLPLTILLALSTSAGVAAASETIALDKGDKGALNAFPAHVLPVLVEVNSKGQVTEVDPAYRLSPHLQRIVKQNITRMVSKPAVDKSGNPIPSQFVMNLRLDTSPREDGSFDAQIQYVSAEPVPAGEWAWTHVDGRNLALMDRSRLRDDGGAREYHVKPPPAMPPQQPQPPPTPPTPQGASEV